MNNILVLIILGLSIVGCAGEESSVLTKIKFGDSIGDVKGELGSFTKEKIKVIPTVLDIAYLREFEKVPEKEILSYAAYLIKLEEFGYVFYFNVDRKLIRFEETIEASENNMTKSIWDIRESWRKRKSNTSPEQK